MVFFLKKWTYKLLLSLPEIYSYIKEKQTQILRFLLYNYNINKNKLGLFVLDNASNNNIVLLKLQKAIKFDF